MPWGCSQVTLLSPPSPATAPAEEEDEILAVPAFFGLHRVLQIYCSCCCRDLTPKSCRRAPSSFLQLFVLSSPWELQVGLRRNVRAVESLVALLSEALLGILVFQAGFGSTAGEIPWLYTAHFILSSQRASRSWL